MFKEIRNELANMDNRSAWKRGVTEYALELVDELEERFDNGYVQRFEIITPNLLKKVLLNGAADWSKYSWGGCALIYNEDIAERLCCPSELKKTRNGERRPNSGEEWLDTQARALYQAANRVVKAINRAQRREG